MARVGDIIARPHRAQLDAKRVADLERVGGGGVGGIAVVYEPGTGYVLLGGEHRLRALLRRGQREAEVFVLRSWRDFVAWMILDLERDRRYSGTGWTVVDAAYLAIKAYNLLKPARDELPYNDLAEFCQVHEGAMSNCRWLIQLADDPQESAAIRDYARAELQIIHTGMGGAHGVRERVKKQRAKLAAATTPPMPVPKQAALLGDIVARLTGITNGLDVLGELNPAHDQKDLTAWYEALGKANTEIIRLRTKLKDHLKGQQP